MNLSATKSPLAAVPHFADAFASVEHLDLGPIKVKLMELEEGEGWTVAQVNAVEIWYKRFLYLNLKYPSDSVVPTKAIDTFWHYHILDTQKYFADCNKVFGAYFHHFPYFGMRGADDARALSNAFDATTDLFLAEFGEPLSSLDKFFPAGDGASLSKYSKCKQGNCRSCRGSVCKSKVADQARPTFGAQTH